MTDMEKAMDVEPLVPTARQRAQAVLIMSNLRGLEDLIAGQLQAIRSTTIEECAKHLDAAAEAHRAQAHQAEPRSQDHYEHIGAAGALLGAADAIRSLSQPKPGKE